MRIVIGSKIDLDTTGAALLLGISREDEVVVVVRDKADPVDLADRTTICIEVGGAGDIQLNNWDHHGEGAEGLRSVTRQAAAYSKGIKPDEYVIAKLVDYIDQLDVEGPQALPQAPGFPSLSDIFSGMLLKTRDSVEQFHSGVEILREVAHRKLDPYGVMPTDKPEWVAFAEAKAENDRQVAKAVESAQWGTTKAGLKLGYLETDFRGAPGALYEVGAQVVVAYSRHFGPNRVPKFTIAGNGIKVNGALPELNAREPGWGGPGTGTILGSPREGSKLSLDEVVRIVRETL